MRAPLLTLTAALWAVPCLAAPSLTHPVDVPVSSYHIRVGDLIADLEPASAAVDLGPAPAANGSRVVDREEIVRAFHDHGLDPPRHIPAAMRVVRKMQHLDPKAVEDVVRSCLAVSLTRGATVAEVSASRTSVPDGWTRATCQVPRPPHKAGPLTSTASVVFFEEEQALWRISVPVGLSLSQEASQYDVPRGTHLTLVIRRGLVEVGTAATAGADADVGDLMPVFLLPSGRTISARVEDRDHAVALGSP
jgi:hypothetical protein